MLPKPRHVEHGRVLEAAANAAAPATIEEVARKTARRARSLEGQADHLKATIAARERGSHRAPTLTPSQVAAMASVS